MVCRRKFGRIAVDIAAVLRPLATLAEPAAAGTVPQAVIVSSGTNVILDQAPWQVDATGRRGWPSPSRATGLRYLQQVH